jgi:hypothetical protein
MIFLVSVIDFLFRQPTPMDVGNVGADPGRNPYLVAWMFDGRLMGMEQLPRLVSGNCPNCSSAEIIVKTVDTDGTNYEGYCPGCGIDIVGTLINGMTKAVVLK